MGGPVSAVRVHIPQVAERFARQASHSREAGSADPDRTADTPSGATVINLYTSLATLVSVAQDRLRREEKGATAVEYGLMVGLIAVVIIAAVVFLGEELNGLFETIGDELSGAGGEAPAAG
jgi:pilus assembly protein Flp/PilA